MTTQGLRSELWRGRRVLVTGHSGFKGAWLSLWLKRLGARLSGFSLPAPTHPSLHEAAGIEALLEPAEPLGPAQAATLASSAPASARAAWLGDVRDPDALRDALARAKPEAVFHLAAQALVHDGHARPLETYATNVMGTLNLLEAVRATPSVRAVVIVTSDKCYREQPGLERGLREDDPLGGHDPYSSSKACAELVTDAYRHSYFAADGSFGRHPARLVTVRAGNVIGGGDWARKRLVPDVVRALRAGKPVALRSPGAVRPWQHVLNPLDGYLRLAERLLEATEREPGQDLPPAWNFGPALGDHRPVGWLVEALLERFGHGSWESDAKAPGEQGPREVLRLELDPTQARERLGWRPRLKLERALDWCVEWYEAERAGADLRRLCEEQIDRYEAGPDA